MKIRNYLFWALSLVCTVTACGQRYKNHNHDNSGNMDTSVIKNRMVKEAIDAFQSSDVTKWLSLFSDDAVLLDDGKPRNFKKFSTKAIQIEKFTSIDKVEDNGTSVYGHFHSDVWGDFKAYFKFQFNEAGKITVLEIGQANY
ncbi:hypothetical protein [Larkinella arboricola]